MSIDKTKIPNALALGFVDTAGAVEAISGNGDGKSGLKAFVAFCQQHGQTAGYLPGAGANKKGYRFKSIANWYGHPEKGLLLPPGFTLIGDGSGGTNPTKLYQDPASFGSSPVNWPPYGFIFYQGSDGKGANGGLQGLAFDMQRQIVNGGKETSYTCCPVQAAYANVYGAYHQDLYFTGNVGGSHENFCFATGAQETGSLLVQVRCLNNNGTGISLNGDMVKERQAPGTGLNKNIELINCTSGGNSWQGATLFGARGCKVINFTGFNNGYDIAGRQLRESQGLNLEWTYDVTVDTPTCYGNVGAGVGGFGDHTGLVIEGSNGRVYNNNAAGDWTIGEIGFRIGSWWQGNLTGLLRSMAISGVGVTPRSGFYHLGVGRFDDTAHQKVKQVTYPTTGPAAVPQISCGIAGSAVWKLTPFTDMAGCS